MNAPRTTTRVPVSSHSIAPDQLPPVLRRAVTLATAGPALWRVIDRSGRVIGHLHARGAGADTRYRARRFHAASGRFRDLGEFWAPDDAVDCLLFSR